MADELTRPSVLGDVNIASFHPLHFSPLEISAVIMQHGNEGSLRRALVCPCARVETGMGSVGCKACGGLSFVYPQELRCKTSFLDHGRMENHSQRAVGFDIDGSISVAFPAGVIPGRGDMLLPKCEPQVVLEQHHRALRQQDRAELARRQTDQRQGPLRVVPARAERLIYPDVLQVEGLFWTDDDGKLIEGKEGRDFRLERGNGVAIKWIGTRGPAQGQGYSIRYLAPTAYIVMRSGPTFRHENNINLPYTCRLERLNDLEERDLRSLAQESAP